MKPEIQKALRKQTPPGDRLRRQSVKTKRPPKAAAKAATTPKASEAKAKKE